MRAMLPVVAFLAVSLAGCVGGPLNPEGPIDRSPDEMDHEAFTADGSWDLSYFGVDGDPFLGNASAPVQVVAYDAPGCPNCKRYHDVVYPDIKADHIETGNIGYHFLQWRVGYAYDIDGGIAEECAYREGGTEVYEDTVGRVFANQDAGFTKRSDNLPDILRAVAEDHGLDEEALLACYEGEETKDEVDADIDAGKASGAGSNPGFAVLGPDGYYEYIRGSTGPGAAIERALAA